MAVFACNAFLSDHGVRLIPHLWHFAYGGGVFSPSRLVSSRLLVSDAISIVLLYRKSCPIPCCIFDPTHALIPTLGHRGQVTEIDCTVLRHLLAPGAKSVPFTPVTVIIHGLSFTHSANITIPQASIRYSSHVRVHDHNPRGQTPSSARRGSQCSPTRGMAQRSLLDVH